MRRAAGWIEQLRVLVLNVVTVTGAVIAMLPLFRRSPGPRPVRLQIWPGRSRAVEPEDGSAVGVRRPSEP